MQQADLRPERTGTTAAAGKYGGQRNWDVVRPGENGELSTVSITGGHQHRPSQKVPPSEADDRRSNPTEEQREQAFDGLSLPSSLRFFPLEAAASRKHKE